jgi:energy-converting hydrogenase A subunit M
MFIKEDLIEDLCTDEAGQLMTAMHKIETWTKAKRDIFNRLTELLEKMSISTSEIILTNTTYQ